MRNIETDTTNNKIPTFAIVIAILVICGGIVGVTVDIANLTVAQSLSIAAITAGILGFVTSLKIHQRL